MTQRPNILFLFTDQHTAGAMSCAGNPDLRTEALDRLAQEGTRFERAYCTQPLCTPSRASLLTGRMPRQAGAPRNEMSISEHLRDQEMGRLLEAGGYECAYGGKWHLPMLTCPEGRGFRRLSGFNDNLLTEACVSFLRERHERPFLLVASFDNPHNICEWARTQRMPWASLPPPPPAADCPSLPANFAVPPYEPEAIRLEQAADAAIYPTALFAPDDWRRYRWAYYRLVEKADALIAQVLDALEQAGLKDDTLVVFTSDHGDGTGAHQWSQKSVLYEESIRVPLIVRLPGAAGAGAVDREHLVSSGLDLLPTFLDYSGLERPPGLEGASLRPLAEGGAGAPWRQDLVVETIFDGDRGYATAGRAVLTGRYKYIVYGWGRHREQLFDLERDPGEMVDLAVNSRHVEVLNDHRRRLIEWCQRTGDNARRWIDPGAPAVP